MDRQLLNASGIIDDLDEEVGFYDDSGASDSEDDLPLQYFCDRVVENRALEDANNDEDTQQQSAVARLASTPHSSHSQTGVTFTFTFIFTE